MKRSKGFVTALITLVMFVAASSAFAIESISKESSNTTPVKVVDELFVPTGETLEDVEAADKVEAAGIDEGEWGVDENPIKAAGIV